MYNVVSKNSKIFFIDPVGYLEMMWLLNNCKFVVTDSGGIQKEAFFFKKYCLTLREETEWIELIENGCNQLVELEKEKILCKINEFINKPFVFAKELYGDGKTAEKIIQLLIN